MPSSISLRKNRCLVVEGVGHLFGRGHESSRLIHVDAVVGVDRAGYGM